MYGKDIGLFRVLAIFLGGLGAHRFYLGQFALGFVYLIFCWTFIPAILGVIDAIRARAIFAQFEG